MSHFKLPVVAGATTHATLVGTLYWYPNKLLASLGKVA